MEKKQTLLPAFKRKEIAKAIAELPITSAREQLIKEIETNRNLVIVGETGSGKTTQIPQYVYQWMLDEWKDAKANGQKYAMKNIAITQPRRVAAISVANRVKDEVQTRNQNPAIVGYRVRFEDDCTKQTRIKYLTDGMLLREAILDKTLSKYRVIIIDEAHERTIHTDVLLGLIFEIQKQRLDLKVIVMSATLDSELFSRFFSAKILYVAGRQYPVNIFYATEPQSDYVDAALITTLQIHVDEPPGDILVFLTGREEIEALELLLTRKSKYLPPDSMQMLICPLFAALPPQKQMKIFEKTPPHYRKIVIATNIAETSLTINGISYVVDCGLVKARTYNPKIGIDSLTVVPISKAGARQRCGRAGREREGFCYRLYMEDTFDTLEDNPIPEIRRCNLDNVILQMKAIGIDDIIGFPFIERPPLESIRKALEILLALGALSVKGKLTEIGKKMAELPLEPMFAKSLIISMDFECFEEVLIIVSMLSVESIFYTPFEKRKEANSAKKRFAAPEGDHITLLNIYKEYTTISKAEKKNWCHENFINLKSINKVQDVLLQLQEYTQEIRASQINNDNDNEDSRMSISDVESITVGSFSVFDRIGRCFASAFFRNAAVLTPSGCYRSLLDNKECVIHPSSVLSLTPNAAKPKAVIFTELVKTSKLYMRDLCVIRLEWLVEVAPQYFRVSA